MTEIETGVSYMANRWPHHFIRDLDDIVDHGCTYVVHTLSENDALFLRGTMARFFRLTRDAGLGCWADPWGVMGLFGGEAFSAYVPRNPDGGRDRAPDSRRRGGHRPRCLGLSRLRAL